MMINKAKFMIVDTTIPKNSRYVIPKKVVPTKLTTPLDIISQLCCGSSLKTLKCKGGNHSAYLISYNMIHNFYLNCNRL